MPSDWIILIATSILSILAAVLLTHKSEVREALVVFFFKQLMTWMLGLIVVEFDLIEYPVRLFKYATASSFSFEYFIYPAMCVIFVLRFPENRSVFHKIGWYVFFSTWMTLAEVWLEQHTNLIHYIQWNWLCTWVSLLVTFLLSRIFYKWFFRKKFERNP
ncbi:MAG TPA: CBO0543 family protein [Bacillales bacterium]|nr:CBO0543 family protein [Bacillales bacterium]